MKRMVAALVVLGCASMVHAQATMDEGPAHAPQTVEVQGNGHCQTVRAGDTVHYSLTIDGVESARSVFANLQLRTGHAAYRETDLPMPGTGLIGGGSAGARDGSGKVYQFAFQIPAGVQSGVYRAVGVVVTLNQNVDEPIEAEVDRHAREQVRHFCLAVFGAGSGAPVVTEFHPGAVERK